MGNLRAIIGSTDDAPVSDGHFHDSGRCLHAMHTTVITHTSTRQLIHGRTAPAHECRCACPRGTGYCTTSHHGACTRYYGLISCSCIISNAFPVAAIHLSITLSVHLCNRCCKSIYPSSIDDAPASPPRTSLPFVPPHAIQPPLNLANVPPPPPASPPTFSTVMPSWPPAVVHHTRHARHSTQHT